MTSIIRIPTDPDETEAPSLGQLLMESATAGRDRDAVQALVEERTLLEHPAVRAALVVEERGRPKCRWEDLAGRVYTLGLDEGGRAFLGLVLSLVGIGHVTVVAVQALDEHRLAIFLRAVLRLSGNTTIAVGTRL
ncbi:hypothetical protein ACFW91_24805 [Streptomyces asoensis]|uniref:hypothetical protein n=1 Tax=Streptomyces asoensis TaxID=249586 RepID=UPI0036BC28A0